MAIRIEHMDLFRKYFRLHGNLNIPGKFKLSDDDRINNSWSEEEKERKNVFGPYAARITSHYRIYGESHFDAKDVAELNEMNMVWDKLGDENKIILAAAKTYVKLNPLNSINNLLKFDVPSNATYPEETWGLPLGERLYNIKLQKSHKPIHSELRALGLKISETVIQSNIGNSVSADNSDSLKTDDKFGNECVDSKIMEALTIFKLNKGHCIIPEKYICSESFWPDNFKTFQLGKTAVQLRTNVKTYNKYCKTDVDTITNLGFAWVLRDDKARMLLSALAVYKSKFGKLNVPRDFVVPNEPNWPVECVGLRLGMSLSNLVYGNIYSEHRQAFVDLGVSFKVKHRSKDSSCSSTPAEVTGASSSQEPTSQPAALRQKRTAVQSEPVPRKREKKSEESVKKVQEE